VRPRDAPVRHRGAQRCSLRGVSTDADGPSQDPTAEGPAEPQAPAEVQPDPPAQAEAPEPAQPQAAADAPAPEPEPAPAAPEPAHAVDPPPEAEAPAAAAAQEAPSAPEGGTGAPAAEKKPGKPRRKREKRPRRPNVPKDLPRGPRAPLPLDELRDASRATLDLFGQSGIREAFLILAPRERQDISALIAQDEDHRPRARNIANGSIGAGRIDKAMSATIISMAKIEDLWSITLDKETAAEKSGRIRAAKQRDKQKAERAKERANRSDRVSREDMEKARDGSVGATIRIVTEEKRERRPKGEPPAEQKPQRESVLDKLGY